MRRKACLMVLASLLLAYADMHAQERTKETLARDPWVEETFQLLLDMNAKAGTKSASAR